MLLEKLVSRTSVATIVGVSPTALHHFIRTRKLDPKVFEGPDTGASPLEHHFASIWSTSSLRAHFRPDP